jgi:hypothetical protein
MRYATLGLFVVAMIIGSGCSMTHKKESEAHEKKLMPSDVPPKVMSAMDTRFPGAQYTSITREEEKGNTIYDFELTQGGRKYEADVKEDGTIVEIEKAIESRDLPAPVADTLNKKYPNATYKEVMEKDLVSGKQETPHEYEIVVQTPKGKDEEVTVSREGKIVHE